MKVTRSPKAEEDLEEIYEYTLDEWSEEQADEYLASLYSRFETLTPGLGRARDELARGLRSLPHGSHLIFFTLESEDELVVVRVIHGARDIEDIFKTSP